MKDPEKIGGGGPKYSEGDGEKGENCWETVKGGTY